jgi:hypothetical protein
MMTPLQRIRHNLSKTSLRLPKVWFDHRGLTLNDGFVASYPRSGSTWLRFVLWEALTDNSSAFNAVDEGLPYVGSHGKAAPLLPNGGRILKTHEAFRPEYHKAVYLIRDPRDVALSEHKFEQALGAMDCDLTEFLRGFLDGTVGGYAAWHNHAESWLNAAARAPDRYLIVKFEDLRANTEHEVTAMLEFFGCVANPEKVRAAVENNALDKMRAKEDKNPQKASGSGSRLVGQGAVRGWEGKMTSEQLAMIERTAGPVMERLGYPLAQGMTVGGRG